MDVRNNLIPGRTGFFAPAPVYQTVRVKTQRGATQAQQFTQP